MAASAGGIRAGKAFVELGANDSGLKKALDGAAKSLKTFGNAVNALGTKMAALGAIGSTLAAPIALTVKTFADMGTELSDAAARTGLSVEALSALGHAAIQTGTDLAGVEMGIKKTQKKLVEAAEGSIEATAAFNGLGLSVRKLAGMNAQDQFAAVATAIGKVKNPTLKAAHALEIFGRGGTALVPMANNFAALAEEAQKFGLVWTGDEAKQADKLGDTLDLLWQIGKKLVAVIGSALAPVITELGTKLAHIGKNAMDWIQANQALIATALKVVAGVAAASAVIGALGVTLLGVGTVISGFGAAFGLIGAVIGAVLSPLGLLAAALAAAVAYFPTLKASAGDALGWIGAKFAWLKAEAIASFGGIADAIRAGNIQLAVQILWSALKLEWLKGTQYLQALWSDWQTAAVDLWKSLQTKISSILIDTWAGLQKIWLTGTTNIQLGFGDFVGGIQDAWTSTMNFLANAYDGFITNVKNGLTILAGEFKKYHKFIEATARGTIATASGRKWLQEDQAKIDQATKDTIGKRNEAQRTAEVARNKALKKQQEDRAKGQADLGSAEAKGLGQIEQQRQGSQAALASSAADETQKRHDAAAEALGGAAFDLAKAQKELDDLNSQAAAANKNLVGAVDKTKGGGEGDALDRGLAGAGSAKAESKGTFSAFGTSALGTGDTLSEIAKEAIKQTEELMKLNRKAAVGRLAFTD